MFASLLSLVPGRLVLTAEYAINCADADWVNPNDPAANCTRTKGVLWQVNGSAAVHDAATDAATGLLILHFGQIDDGSQEGSLLGYAHVNASHASFVEMGIPGQSSFREVDLGWPERAPWSPERFMWMRGTWALEMLQWTSYRSCGTAVPYCNVTKGLYLASGQPMKRDTLWSYSNNTSPIAPPPPGQDIATAFAADRDNGLVYSQVAPGAPVSVFSLATKGFKAALPASAAYECLHFDSTAGRLGALIADAGGYSLVSIDTTTGKTTARAAVPVPSELTLSRSPGTNLVCSLSQASGTLSLLAARVDGTAPLFAANAEIHVLNVDTRAATSAWVKVGLGELSPAGAGRSWRLVAPYLSNTDA